MNEVQRRLDEDGYVLLRQVIAMPEARALIARLDALWAEEGDQAGSENYLEPNAWRLANLANKGDVFRAVLASEAVLEAVRAVIGPRVRLSMINARAVPPHSDPRQPFHCDTRKRGKPDAHGYYVCTAVWMLDDFTPENGATRLVPGTHRSRQLPKEALADVYAPHPDEVIASGCAGDVLVFNGHCWHAGGPNTTDRPRRAILVHYIRADHPQELNQKQALAPEVQARMTPRERELLGLDDGDVR